MKRLVNKTELDNETSVGYYSKVKRTSFCCFRAES